MSQTAFDVLKQVSVELDHAQRALDAKLQQEDCKGTERKEVAMTRANLEKTYLLRLLADFEGQLATAAAVMTPAIVFNQQAGLANKLQRISASKKIDKKLQVEVDDKIRLHRNELMHGRTPIPRVSFGTSHELMKQFLRNCF